MKTENLVSFLIAIAVIILILSVTIGLNYGSKNERQFKIEMAKQGMMQVVVKTKNGYTYQCWRPAYSNSQEQIQFEDFEGNE
jgi:hypothetical protein